MHQSLRCHYHAAYCSDIMACGSCSFVCRLHHLIIIIMQTRLIWRHWTTKMLVRYMLPTVCLRSRQFSQLSFIHYMGLCVFSLPNSPVMTWECVLYLIIIIKPEVWIINHCLWLGHETMVCAVCLTMFLFTEHDFECYSLVDTYEI